ncbi:FKBP-type peptidyl-prolyl cis-trans isomerase [Undibacterium cyanobacteriorum]|uniref:FKBP-type peptidyl-prolyl cis-trans isomerase n=1 Tax=Undibacterium cyanobacteriorum TaxID=3073561 RepID=UPI0035A2FD4A
MKLSSILVSLLFCGVASTSFAQVQASAASTDANPNLALLNGPGPLHVQKLVSVDTQVGTGDEVKNGDVIEVHYTGWLYNSKAPNLRGAKFDSSRDSGTPLNFMVGGRQVIRGWDIGVIGMKVGGKRTLLIPAYLGYSTQGSGNIPPNAHLYFEVELLAIKK